jgi:hypothetical protein
MREKSYRGAAVASGNFKINYRQNCEHILLMLAESIESVAKLFGQRLQHS